MIFAFTGFSQEGTYRIFSYELLPRSAARGTYRVRADTALARQYRIGLQDLPILCRALLENQTAVEPVPLTTYSGAEMRAYADARDAAQESRKARSPRPPRRRTT